MEERGQLFIEAEILLAFRFLWSGHIPECPIISLKLFIL